MKKIITFIFFVLIILSFVIQCRGQATWVKTYNIDYPPSQLHFDSATVGPLEMCTTPDGTVLTLMQINQEHDVWLVALDTLGNIKWKRIAGHHGGIFHEDSYSLHPTMDNGCTYFFRHEGSYIEDKVYRINNSGGQVWTLNYIPTTIGMNNLVESIVPTFYNTYYLQFKDSLVELDSNGNYIRHRTPFSYTARIISLPDSDFVILDSSRIIKEDFSGNQRWNISAPGIDFAVANMNCIYARSLPGILKINTLTGNIVWTRSIPARMLSMTTDEGFVIASGDLIAKYDSSGTLQWSKTFSLLQCGVRAVVEIPNHTYIAGGGWKTMDAYYNSAGDGWAPIFARLDSIGKGIADSTDYFYNANANDNSILSFADDAVFVAAAMGNSGSKRDSLTIGREPGKDVFATNWPGSFSVGINYKYSDVDGNGLVDTSDVNLLPYLYLPRNVSSHWRAPVSSFNNPAIRFAVENDTIAYTDTIKIDVILASPGLIIDSIYGLSFDLGLFGINAGSQSIYSTIIIPPSGLGDTSQNLFSYYFNRPSGLPQLTQMVLCRTDHANVSLSGDTIARLYFVYPPTSVIYNQVTMNVQCNAITKGGFPLTLNVVTDPIVLFGSTGIIDFDNSEIKIFPNPASDQLIFSFEKENINELDIFDETGRKIFSTNNPENNYVLDVRDFSEGIYIAQSKSDARVSRSKFLVIH